MSEEYETLAIFYPNFDKVGKVHDWRNYVPEEYKNDWEQLTTRERMIIINLCQIQADKEDWD